MKKDALMRVCQKALIERDGKVLVISDPVEGLDFPGGKVQEDELRDSDVSSLTEALKREVREETGLEIEVLEPFFAGYYEYSEGHRNQGQGGIYLTAFRARYVSGEVVLSDEHDGYKWVSKDSYKEIDDGTSFFDILEKYFQ